MEEEKNGSTDISDEVISKNAAGKISTDTNNRAGRRRVWALQDNLSDLLSSNKDECERHRELGIKFFTEKNYNRYMYLPENLGFV